MSTIEEWHDKANSIQFDVRPVIGGVRVASTSEKTMECFRPSDGSSLYTLPVGSAVDVESAVTTARQIYDQGHWATCRQ